MGTIDMRVPVLSLLLLLASSPHVCDGTSLLPMTLQGVAARANIVFAGTVDTVYYRELKDDVVAVITVVEFRKLQFAQGRGGGTTIKLQLYGGILNGLEYAVDLMPRFEVGERYVVLASDEGTKGDSYFPIIGLTEGVFRVKSDQSTGRQLVHDLHGRVLIGIERNHIQVLDNAPGKTIRKAYGVGLGRGEDLTEPALEVYPSELDPGTRVTEDAFLLAIRKVDPRPE